MCAMNRMIDTDDATMHCMGCEERQASSSCLACAHIIVALQLGQ